MNEYIIYILLFFIMVELHRIGTMIKALIITFGTIVDTINNQLNKKV